MYCVRVVGTSWRRRRAWRQRQRWRKGTDKLDKFSLYIEELYPLDITIDFNHLADKNAYWISFFNLFREVREMSVISAQRERQEIW